MPRQEVRDRREGDDDEGQLLPNLINRYPLEFSSVSQCQRIGIRACADP